MAGITWNCLEPYFDNQFPTKYINTPGPLSIAFFFLGFVLISHSIRILFPLVAAELGMMDQPVIEVDHPEQERPKEQVEEHLPGSSVSKADLTRMILLKNKSPRSTFTSRNRLAGFDSIDSSLLPKPFSSFSSSILAPISSADHSNQKFFQQLRRPQTSHHFQDISDSCSSSTTSA